MYTFSLAPKVLVNIDNTSAEKNRNTALTIGISVKVQGREEKEVTFLIKNLNQIQKLKGINLSPSLAEVEVVVDPVEVDATVSSVTVSLVC